MSDPADDGKHPSIGVLLGHVVGSLGFAHRCVVRTHVTTCPACQGTTAFLKGVERRILADVEPVEPPPDLLDRCLASIARNPLSPRRRERARVRQERRHSVGGVLLPPSLAGLKPGRLRWLAPGVRHSTLWQDGETALHLIQVGPGVTLPAHRHRGLELTCVLAGEYHDDNGTLFGVGDVSEEDDGDPSGAQDHLVTAECFEDCVCIMATTGRLLFRNWVARLLQPIMPF